MSNIINIFNTLPQQQSDSEDEQQQVQPQKGQNRRQQDEKPKRGGQQQGDRTQKQQQAPKQGRTGVQGDLSKKEERDYHGHNKDLHKQQKDDLEHPHPNDRHSGHGGSAYGAKPKKGGAGKGNWGNYKDEQNAGETGSPVEGGEAKPKEEEKVSLTLQEYYQQQRAAANQPQVNEAKAKITSEQLLKEMGTATLLKGKNAQNVDDRKAGKKKDTLDVDHKAGINTEHSELLNFRTGFIEKEYKPRDREEGGDFKKRDNRRREEKPEGEKQAEETEGQTAEAQPVEGTNQETEQGQGNRRRQGGYQGERRGYEGERRGYEGERRGYEGERRGYGGRGGNRGYGKRYNQGEGEGRFQGDEQGEQGTSTGYTYKGGRGGNRQGGYRGGQNRNRQPREGQQQQQPREGQQQQQQAGEQGQQQPQRQEQQPRTERPQGGNRGGDRPQGGRKPYGKGPQPKVNVADEAAFPKLG